MQLDYTFYYVEANIVCIIIFGMMLIREMGSVGRQTKQVIFVNITISHMLYFISDIAWVLILADIIPYTRFSAAAANFTNALLLCAITGLWFVYVELSQGEQYITSYKMRMLVLVPAMVPIGRAFTSSRVLQRAATAASRMSWVSFTKSALLATKSVSHLRAMMAANLPSTFTTTQPSLASRSLRLAATA